MIVSVNEIEKRAVCVNGKIEIRPMVYLNFTVDHRFMDGGRAKKIYEIVILMLIFEIKAFLDERCFRESGKIFEQGENIIRKY